MVDSRNGKYESCSLCGMPKLPTPGGHPFSWRDEHEELLIPKGVRVFCFLKGDTAETFWEYLRSQLRSLDSKSCTASAIENKRAPEWIRQCALEEMNKERNTRQRERYEKIANFCKRRAYELAPKLECVTRLRADSSCDLLQTRSR